MDFHGVGPTAPFFQAHQQIHMDRHQTLPPPRPHHHPVLPTFPPLTEEQVLESLQFFVEGNCCYGDSFLKEIKMKEFLPTPIFAYTLDFFIETRNSEWVTEPYRGEYLIQEFPTALPVDIWSVHIPPPVRFGSSKKSHVVPSSTSVVNCAQCTGIGNVQCGMCAGSMSTTCNACAGSGTVMAQKQDGTTKQVKCIKCKGKRRTACDGCKGKGTATCKSCHGFRRVKNYEKLTVTWSTVSEESVHKEGGLVGVAKLKFGGLAKTIIAESSSLTPQDLLPFIVFRPVLDSKYDIQCSIPHQRVLEIRQKVIHYPATEVICTRKSRDHRFLIYGDERIVYFPKGYPQSCCSVM